MRQGRSTTTPTRAEAARFDAIRDLGCLVALLRNLPRTECEIHHLLLDGHHGQRRRGHMATIGLNSWSHRGVPIGRMSAKRCREVFGPSLALEPNRFRAEIGRDDYLLEAQNTLLARYEAIVTPPWSRQA